MKALSIKQPWASLIAHGIKDIENRTWRTSFRGRIYIHATKWVKHRFQGDMYDEIQWIFIRENAKYCLPFLEPNCIENRLPVSAIIGEVDIVDCVVNHPSIWAEKTPIVGKTIEGEPLIKTKPIYNWVLANAVLYDNPIQDVKGRLNFWNYIEIVPDSVNEMEVNQDKNNDHG